MTVTYHSLSDSMLTDLIRKAARPDQYVSAQTIAERFEISTDTLKALVREGKIREYRLDDHERVVRYSINEIQEQFKPKQI